MVADRKGTLENAVSKLKKKFEVFPESCYRDSQKRTLAYENTKSQTGDVKFQEV